MGFKIPPLMQVDLGQVTLSSWNSVFSSEKWEGGTNKQDIEVLTGEPRWRVSHTEEGRHLGHVAFIIHEASYPHCFYSGL